MKKMAGKIFSGLFLFLVYGVASAAPDPTISSSAVANHTDLSVAYLAQVFGTVGGVLQGTSGQMLGHLFYQLNIGILVVAGLWLGYTGITVVLKSAQEGSFMGQNKNIAVVLLKIVLGIGLLLPNANTGYSIFQDVVMKVVVEGVALADQTWSYGLKYINNGGSLWRDPGVKSRTLDTAAIHTLMGQVSSAAPSMNKYNDMGLAQKIFLNEVCMYASNVQNAANASSNTNSSSLYNTAPPPQSFSVVTDKGGHSFKFPGGSDNPDLNGGKAVASCGSVNWAAISGANCSSATSASNLGTCQYAKNATHEMVTALLPAAKSYVCSQTSVSGVNNSPVCGVNPSMTSVNQTASNAFFAGLMNYANGVIPIQQKKNAALTAGARGFISTAKKEGWLTAGRYYWDLSQIQGEIHDAASLKSYAAKAISLDSSGNSPYKNNQNVKRIVDTAASATTLYVKNATHTVAQYTDTNAKGRTFNYHMGRQSGVAGTIMNSLMVPMVNLIVAFEVPPNDPTLFLHMIGMDCLGLSGLIWFGMIAIVGGALAATALCESVVNAAPAVNGVVDWIKPPLYMLATMMLVVGVILGYYVPLYPYMIFTFGVIAWLIAVIEAMVAAPLVCLGLTHPEGHDFLGEAKQALMLLLGVFLRPVLMVVGLIAGMILSYVAFKILIYTYSGFIGDLMYAVMPVQSANYGGVLANAVLANINVAATAGGPFSMMMAALITFPLFLIIFAMLTYIITNQCYSLIYSLPDNIMRWIGAPTTPSTAAQMASQVQGMMSNGGQTVGRAASDAHGAYMNLEQTKTDIDDADKKGQGGLRFESADKGGKGGKGGGGKDGGASANVGS